MTGYDAAGSRRDSVLEKPVAKDIIPGDSGLALDDFPVGSIRPVSRNVCVARLGEDEFSAVSRYCPHAGGDLTSGWIEDGKIVCPLHSLAIDPHTGASRCNALKPLRVFPCEVRNGRIFVGTSEPDAAQASGPGNREFSAR